MNCREELIFKFTLCILSVQQTHQYYQKAKHWDIADREEKSCIMLQVLQIKLVQTIHYGPVHCLSRSMQKSKLLILDCNFTILLSLEPWSLPIQIRNIIKQRLLAVIYSERLNFQSEIFPAQYYAGLILVCLTILIIWGSCIIRGS